jgi:hypothetical protein
VLTAVDELARIIHEYRREAAEIEACRGFSQVRATQADLRSVEEIEREKSRQAMGSAAVAGIHELSGLVAAVVRIVSCTGFPATTIQWYVCLPEPAHRRMT